MAYNQDKDLYYYNHKSGLTPDPHKDKKRKALPKKAISRISYEYNIPSGRNLIVFRYDNSNVRYYQFND